MTSSTPPLNHIAIIMDGNGRWAQKRGHQRFWGHVRGSQVAQKIIETGAKAGLKYMTLFAFSTENWKRPQQEVEFLMKLLERHLKRKKNSFNKYKIKLKTIGDLTKLPPSTQKLIDQFKRDTADNTGMVLTFALNYGGRQDIVSAIKNLEPHELSNIDEASFSQKLSTNGTPDPDLLIRTGGEVRISNFLLWQCSYSEFFFSNKLWPDYTVADFQQVLSDYSQIERRFGNITATVLSKPNQRDSSSLKTKLDAGL